MRALGPPCQTVWFGLLLRRQNYLVRQNAMQLLDFLKQLKPQELESFALNCCTTVDYLWKLARLIRRGKGRAQAELAVAIERHSDKKVCRWESNPDRWHLWWPELIGADGAPDLPAANDPARPSVDSQKAA